MYKVSLRSGECDPTDTLSDLNLTAIYCKALQSSCHIWNAPTKSSPHHWWAPLIHHEPTKGENSEPELPHVPSYQHAHPQKKNSFKMQHFFSPRTLQRYVKFDSVCVRPRPSGKIQVDGLSFWQSGREWAANVQDCQWEGFWGKFQVWKECWERTRRTTLMRTTLMVVI